MPSHKLHKTSQDNWRLRSWRPVAGVLITVLNAVASHEILVNVCDKVELILFSVGIDFYTRGMLSLQHSVFNHLFKSSVDEFLIWNYFVM